MWRDPQGLSGLARRVVPTEDTNKIFVWVQYSSNWSAVYAYYIDNESNRTLQNIESQNTDIELTPDDETLIFTDPSDFIYTSSRNVYLAETENDNVYSIVPVPFIAHPFWTNRLNSSEIAITPDGRIAIFASIGSSWQGVISIREREYSSWFAIDTSGSGAYGRSVACRKNQ